MASTSRLAGPAHKLPKLLSLLPADGRGSLVRPLSAKGVMYRITRSKLKFIPRPAGEGDAMGQMSVAGRAWGVKFVNGKLTRHTDSTLPTTKFDGLVRGALKSRWVQVDETTLDEATRRAISDSNSVAQATPTAKA